MNGNRLRQEDGERMRKFAGSERGVALITALLLLVLLGGISLVAMNYSSMDISRNKKYVQSREAFYMAEAGIQKALYLLNYDGSENSPGYASNGMTAVINSLVTDNASDLTNVSFNGGTYDVTVQDNDDGDGNTAADVDNTVILLATGTRNDVTVTIRALIGRTLYKAKHAITTQGNLGGAGSFTVSGSNGSVHSNGSVDISGSANTITQGATATFVCEGEGCVAGGVAPESIPIVSPSAFASYANYKLKTDGTIYEVATGITYSQANPGADWIGSDAGSTNGQAKFGAWSYSSGGGGYWKVNSATQAANGMYYSEDDVKVQNTPSGWETTILSEGYIDFSAGGDIVNYKNASHTADIQNLFLVAKTDIEFSGNPSNVIEGIIACQEQLSVSGTVSLQGYVVSADIADAENLVSPESTISGNMSIEYNGDTVAPFLSNKVVVMDWKEI